MHDPSPKLNDLTSRLKSNNKMTSCMQAFMRSLSPTPAEKKINEICSALSPLF
jgi:fructose-bisphosphate aldolase class 1